ncbi:hypothetical protein [Paraflavitalea sp. CAU 1676]|uniref:hypothetical protein n=1 Tax=Paraflavitalea sp. CAU 1676 TaxID=3032598 RepID=UPI0023DA9077|nr:hypothetical protein [Paraflavitalea sp. CAU 1676]MDF2188337.1 hypothetical protein [Paraflavitalea sp. CAU 1676]
MDHQKERLRSYVDPSTNEMLIADFDLPDYLNWVKARPVVGSELLANFLHEWTHRWCFDSRVGAALAFLRLRAGNRVLSGDSAFDDYVRCMTAMLLLEPITEGLSLFAEFDAYPGASAFMSQTLTASCLFFAPAVDTDGRPEILLQGMLQKLRRSPHLVERKAGIYAKTGFDPYAIGYLSIKSLWKQMAGAYNGFVDRDLFLSYLRSYIYDDPGLVLALLKPAHSEVHAAENISNYLLNRVASLLSFQDLESKVALWIDSAEQGKVDVASINSNSEIEEEANFIFEQATVEDFTKGANYENLATWTYMLLEERAQCVLGVMEVRLEADADHTVQVINKDTGENIYTTVSPELANQREGKLYIMAGRKAHGLLSILGIGQRTYLLSSFGAFEDRDLELAKRHVANKDISDGLFETISRKLDSDGLVNTIWNIVSPQVKTVQEHLYGPLCTLNAREADWPQAFKQVRELGIHGLLGYDGELTRAVAGIGLLNSFTLEVEFIKAFAPVLDIDEEALERALQKNEIAGLPIMARSQHSVLALV